jgi:putative hydrolase of the HAD superfamily
MGGEAGTIRALLLDLDDTLVDTAGAFAQSIRLVCERYLPHLDAAGREAALEHWHQDPGGHQKRMVDGEIGYLEHRLARAATLHEAFGGPDLRADGWAGWNADWEVAFRAGWAALPDAGLFLDRAAEAGFVVAVVTNAESDYQWEKVRAAGLGDRIATLIGTDTFGVGKPHELVYRESARLLGFEAGECAFVGDNLENDAVAPADAGMRGIWVNRRSEPADAALARLGRAGAGIGVAADLDEAWGLLASGRFGFGPVLR